MKVRSCSSPWMEVFQGICSDALVWLLGHGFGLIEFKTFIIKVEGFPSLIGAIVVIIVELLVVLIYLVVELSLVVAKLLLMRIEETALLVRNPLHLMKVDMNRERANIYRI